MERLTNRLGNIENVNYVDLISRIESFKILPKKKEGEYLKKQDCALIEQHNIKDHFGVDTLSEAGFYFDEDEQLIKCFYCSKRASRNSCYNDVWKQHLTSCNFVMYLKGYSFFTENDNANDIKYEILMKNDYLYGIKGKEKNKQ